MLLNMSSKFDFLDAVKGNQVPFPELKSLQNPVEELGSQYLTVCKYLVHKISPSILDERWKELAFERILVTGHAELFIYLCSVIQRETSPSFRREFLAKLIKLSLETRVLTKLLLSETVKPSLDQTSHGLLSALVSLPQVMSNVFKLSVPKAFIMVNYYPVLVNGVYECTKQTVERLKLNQDVYLEFLSQLVGRLALNGQASHLWSNLIVAILNSKDDIFLWQRLGRRLVHSSDTDRFIEPLYKEIISSSRSADDIKFFLGDKIEDNDTIVFLMTQKFLTSYVFENMAAARNLTTYLAASSLSVLKKSVDHLLLVWGSNTSLRYRSYSQNLYLATLLALFARSIDRLSTVDKDATLKVVMQGIEVHLRSSDHEVRSINLYVGQKLMKKLNKDGPKLDLGLGGDESVMRFKEKLKGTMTIESSSSRKQVPLPKAGKLIEEVGGDKDEYEKELDDLGKPADCEPTKRKPHYLRDCLEGMTDHENHNWSYTCLETAESLILANPFAAKELAVETTAILLNMQNDCDVDEFTGLRHRALIAACLSNPETVSKYLADQFYEIRTVRHRLDILEVLMTSAQRLANPVAYVKPELSLTDDFLVPAAAQEQEKQWLTQVNERIKSNTRKIATVTKKVEARANGFLPHANSFFFPLIDRFGKLDIVYNLKSEDHYILGRFIYTLAIILSAASQGPVARQMGKRFLQFLWTFRYHVESYVRQAIIFGACVIFTSVPPIYLLEHLRDEVQELRQWLMDVSSGDSNNECVKRSLQAIFVLNEVIEQNSHQSQ